MTGRLKRHIIKLKKEVRAFNRSQLDKIGERRIIKDDGMDGYVELVRLPVRVQTIEGAKDYFEQYEVRECVPLPMIAPGKRSQIGSRYSHAAGGCGRITASHSMYRGRVT